MSDLAARRVPEPAAAEPAVPTPGPFRVVARSPIAPPEPTTLVAGWEVTARRSAAELTLTDLAPLAKVQLKATPDGALGELLGVRFGQSRRDLPHLADVPGAADAPPITLVAGSGPGEWLILAPPGAAGDLIRWCRAHTAAATELVTVVDLSHGRALLRLTGRAAADVLAKLCAVDFSDEATGDGAAFRSSVAEVATDVVRSDIGGVPSYLLHCERSSGQYLFDAFLDAGEEFGIDIDGFRHEDHALPTP